MNAGILLAAGRSKRFGTDKLFCFLRGKPIICHSLKLLHDSPLIDAIFIVANRANKRKIEMLVKTMRLRKVKKILLGGKTRHESVRKSLREIFKMANPDKLVIHNAANPLACESEIAKCLDACEAGASGAAVGKKITSTVKQIGGNATARLGLNVVPCGRVNGLASLRLGLVEKTLRRENLWQVETPQAVIAKDFFKACLKADGGFDYTDDLSVLEAAGCKTRVVAAFSKNIKLTTREDLDIIKLFAGDLPEDFRVGIGEDSHPFKNQVSSIKYPVFAKAMAGGQALGGAIMKNMPKIKAQSDGDIILHALCNAINSALGGGSLGTFATAMCRKGIKDSKKYLQFVLKRMRKKGFRLVNCSLSVEAKKPPIDPLAAGIKKSLSKLLKIPADAIGITATSGEKRTPFGKGEAIKCAAMVLLRHCTVVK